MVVGEDFRRLRESRNSGLDALGSKILPSLSNNLSRASSLQFLTEFNLWISVLFNTTVDARARNTEKQDGLNAPAEYSGSQILILSGLSRLIKNASLPYFTSNFLIHYSCDCCRKIFLVVNSWWAQLIYQVC